MSLISGSFCVGINTYFSIMLYCTRLEIDNWRVLLYASFMKRVNQFTYVIWKEGKYFVAQCLNVDISSFGKSRKEALENLEEAVALYFEDMTSKKFIAVKSPSIVTRPFQYA